MEKPVVLYTKKGCHLCAKAKDMIHRLQKEFPLALREIDITTDRELLRRYRHDIPVVVINEKTSLKGRIAEAELRQALLTVMKG
ncbi:MAG: glutaredoxin family protein [Chloroflexi bacterium]|nr:glutaredoxin family protein [Chloroflexota bacterium]